MSINHSILDYSSAEHIPKKVYSFKSRHLCQWPQGSRRSQVEHSSLVQFSLSASQAIPVTSSVLLSYCFANKLQRCFDDRQESFLPSRKACLSLLKLSIAYLGADSRSPPPAARSERGNKNPRESQDFPSRMGACRDPTQPHGAASDCSKLRSAATSSQGLFQQLGLARVHKWFKYPSCLASARSRACSPRERQNERVLRGPGSRGSAVPRNSLVHQRCRGNGCKPGIWLRNCLF